MLNSIQMGERIMTLRKQKGLSQEALGERLGVSRQAVSKWETGQTTPDVEMITAMSEFFQVAADYLLFGGDSDNTKADELPSNDNNISADSYIASAFESIKRLEYKSKTTLFGMPLFHAKMGRACGVFSIGIISTGIFSVGLLSLGLISLGLISLGLLALGTLSLGGAAFGGIAAGIFAVGGVAIGVFSIGGVSIGMYSLGGCAIASKIALGGYAKGFVAIGDKTNGSYTWHVKDSIPPEVRQEILDVIQRELPNTPKFIVNLFR